MSHVRVHESMCFDSAQDKFWWMDHFLGDQLQDEWRGVGTGSAVVVDAQTGGIVRITTGATTNDAYYIDWQDYRSLHVDQKASIEVRLKLTQTSAQTMILGLHFDGINRIIFLHDTTLGGNWYIFTRNVAFTREDSGVAADTDYHIFRIECHAHGGNHAHFYIDGVETANSPITTNVPDDATDYLQPWLYIQTVENVAKSMDVDYVAVRQDR